MEVGHDDDDDDDDQGWHGDDDDDTVNDGVKGNQGGLGNFG